MNEPQQAMNLNGPLTVYFDGGCPVCRSEINAYQRADVTGQVAWVDVSQCPESDLGTALSRSEALARLHVRLSDGKLLSGARAFVEIWSRLPAWRWLARLARVPGVIQLMEWAYVAFLRLRPLWRRAESTCQAPGNTQ